MPKRVTREIPPRQLQRDDWFLVNGVQGDMSVVTGRPEIKSRYAYVPVGGQDQPMKLPLDATLTISRLEPTEEEIAEQQRGRAMNYIAEATADAHERVATARQKLLDNLDIKDSSWHGNFWVDFAAAQIEAEIWDTVTKVVENRGVDPIAAVHLVRDDLIHRHVRHARFMSMSTSAMSNLCNDLENDVKMRWVRDLEFRIL